MMESIIKVPAIYKKLKLAEKEKIPIYIKGAVGFGKTSAVEYYYRNKSVIKINGKSGSLSEMNNINEIKKSTIIIDDISWITDINSKEYIKRLLKDNNNNHMVLIGRSSIPEWLHESLITKNFIMADERDLVFDEKIIKAFFESNNIEINNKNISKIAKGIL